MILFKVQARFFSIVTKTLSLSLFVCLPVRENELALSSPPAMPVRLMWCGVVDWWRNDSLAALHACFGVVFPFLSYKFVRVVVVVVVVVVLLFWEISDIIRNRRMFKVPLIPLLQGFLISGENESKHVPVVAEWVGLFEHPPDPHRQKKLQQSESNESRPSNIYTMFVCVFCFFVVENESLIQWWPTRRDMTRRKRERERKRESNHTTQPLPKIVFCGPFFPHRTLYKDILGRHTNSYHCSNPIVEGGDNSRCGVFQSQRNDAQY